MKSIADFIEYWSNIYPSIIKQCCRDAGLYVTNKVPHSDRHWFHSYASNQEVEGLTQFDPFSVMLYREDERLQRNPTNDIVWELKPDTTINRELSELNKVHLNLLDPHCKTTTYNPELSADTGMFYCGRPVMERHNYPQLVQDVALTTGPTALLAAP